MYSSCIPVAIIKSSNNKEVTSFFHFITISTAREKKSEVKISVEEVEEAGKT